LQISADRIQAVSNIENPDSVWIEHPKDGAFRYVDADPREGLGLFEELLVETQACQHPEMRWFVAMHEGLFPFVRDLASSRIILLHQGSTQQGKTTGAERFTRLHGLGSVTGNASVAALRNEPDPGLLVLDNKEHVNLTVELIEHLLFLSTGAEVKVSSSQLKCDAETSHTADDKGSSTPPRAHGSCRHSRNIPCFNRLYREIPRVFRADFPRRSS
jgi:hypothetical protein